MKKISQPELALAGSAALAMVILATFFAFSQPQDRSIQQEKIYVVSVSSASGRYELNDHVGIADMRPNSAALFNYPDTSDTQDRDAYHKFWLIRLPEEMGGTKNDTSAFRAYSALGINSHCLMKYWPQEGRKRMEDPCHGDVIRVKDGILVVNTNPIKSGIFAAQPHLELSLDPDGYLLADVPVWDFDKNGIVGIGRRSGAEEFQNAALEDLAQYTAQFGKDLDIPRALSDGTVLSAGAAEGLFSYLHPGDARIGHGLEISFCGCSDRASFQGHGSHHFQAWKLGEEHVYTDQWLYGSSAYPYSKVTFYRNGYELVFSGGGLDETLDIVFDNFYLNKNRSMLEWVSEIKRN